MEDPSPEEGKRASRLSADGTLGAAARNGGVAPEGSGEVLDGVTDPHAGPVRGSDEAHQSQEYHQRP